MKHAVKGKKPHVNSVTIFALVLLSPLPFLSPFSYDLQPVQALPFNNFPPSRQTIPTECGKHWIACYSKYIICPT